jgi:hydroxylamine reductase
MFTPILRCCPPRLTRNSKQYAHFAGNYGGSWWHQREEFESFGGPILMTTNCIVKPKETYIDRLFTTGQAGYPGCPHIPDRKPGDRRISLP